MTDLISPSNDPVEMKFFVLSGLETRTHPVEYVVEAETIDEALEKASDGSTVAERSIRRFGEVLDRDFDADGLQGTYDSPPFDTEAKTSLDGRIEAALAIVTSGTDLLDDIVDMSIPLPNRPGTARIVTEHGTFLVSVQVENFMPPADDADGMLEPERKAA